MCDPQRNARSRSAGLLALAFASAFSMLGVGCGPTYLQLRRQGQASMASGDFGPARIFLAQAEELSPQRVANLNDLGACSIAMAREKFAADNEPAAMRELDSAIAYYTRVIDIRPANQHAMEGKNAALELKGRFDEALRHAQWAADVVGPSARQFVFLAKELDERGDADGALLRYRQAVAVEPQNPLGHVAFARFLLRHDSEKAAVYHLQNAYRLSPGNTWVVDELAARGALPTLGRTAQITP